MLPTTRLSVGSCRPNLLRLGRRTHSDSARLPEVGRLIYDPAAVNLLSSGDLMSAHHDFAAAALLLGLAITLVQAQSHSVTPSASKNVALDSNIPERHKKWLDEDVRWIISDEERLDFKRLTSDTQRDTFVIAFWERRNPTPNAAHNPFKEEHYRRLAYANSHLAASAPGWKTDRGRFYIMWGPPDSMDSHPAFAPPSETWHYGYIEGIGRDVVLTFVDKCQCGEYVLTGVHSDSDPRILDQIKVY